MSDNLRARAEVRVDNKIKFFRNFKAYVIVNAFLAIINWIFTPYFWWVMFPVFFWGIGVFKDFLMAYILVDNLDSESYRESQIQKEMEKLRV